MHYDLMTALYLLFLDLDGNHFCVIQCVKEFKIHSVETLSEVSQKSSLKIVTDVKRKMRSKGKAN